MKNTIEYHESVATFFSDSEEVLKKIQPKLFRDHKIEITILATSEAYNDSQRAYGIKSVKIDSPKDGRREDSTLTKKINQINEFIQRGSDDGGYQANGNKWSIFYLFKELITVCREHGYNFYRGQRQNWPTVPGIYRNLRSVDEQSYASQFEKIYLDISREFPEDVVYYKLEQDKLLQRADQLAILQHYGLPTSLIDITENPFVALQFMSCFKKMWEPQLEIYKIDSNSNGTIDDPHSLVTFVHKTIKNKRIKAQRGAFLNFDKLKNLLFINSDGWNMSSEYQPIERVILSVKFSYDESIDYLKQQEANCCETSDFSKQLRISMEEKKGEKEKEELFIQKYYDNVQAELKRKLAEYHYFVKSLFPDFSDYVNFQNKMFSSPKKERPNFAGQSKNDNNPLDTMQNQLEQHKHVASL